jgi:hypothetical protein
MSARVVYVDFSETATHADTLFSAVRFLEPCDVRWVLDPSYRGHLPAAIAADAVDWLPAGRGFVATLKAAGAAARSVARFRPRAVHVNGAQGRRARAFAILAGGSPAIFSGTHHNAGKLTGGGSQALINRRIRRYGVLADFIRDHVRPRAPTGLAIETVRPVFFPAVTAPPGGGRLRVGIVGSLHPERRDYAGLARALRATPLDPGIDLVVLGDAATPHGRAIRSELAGTPAGGRVTFHDGFLDFPALFRAVAGCDALLPLIHPDTPRFAEYTTVKITGASLLAFGYRKPLILHRALAGLADYRDVSIGYDVPELVGRLNGLARDRARLDAAAGGYAAMDDLDFHRQAARFHALLGLG